VSERPATESWPSVVKDDDHAADMAILLGALPADVPRRGVVHVGAHHGEEVPVFRRFGFLDLLLIEANPQHASLLHQRFAVDDQVRVLSTAIGDRAGEATLLLHTSRGGSTESASLLGMQALQEIVPTLTTRSALLVPMTTLDDLARDAGTEMNRYNVLVVDVQGAERMVFRGGSNFLATCDAVVTEVSLVPLYDGAPLEGELLGELGALGFEPRQSVYHELHRGDHRFVAWGETLLVRNGDGRARAG
jgi:FkbM family methyltransferase